MLSFFCRARSALKQSSLQDIGPNASADRLVSSSHSTEEKDLRVNHPAGKVDNQGELFWLRPHRTNRANRVDSSRMGKAERAHRDE